MSITVHPSVTGLNNSYGESAFDTLRTGKESHFAAHNFEYILLNDAFCFVFDSIFYEVCSCGPHLCNSLRPGDAYRLTFTGSDNGLSPGRRQAIIWTNAGILLIGPLARNFSENSIDNIFIHENAIESVVCEMAVILPRPQCVNSRCLTGNEQWPEPLCVYCVYILTSLGICYSVWLTKLYPEISWHTSGKYIW